jgi:hypothetical protein
MPAELHIRVHPEADDPGSIVEQFPFEPNQSVMIQSMDLIIIDLAGADDTTYVQDWFLNSHDGVYSFYIVSDEEVPGEGE